MKTNWYPKVKKNKTTLSKYHKKIIDAVENFIKFTKVDSLQHHKSSDLHIKLKSFRYFLQIFNVACKIIFELNPIYSHKNHFSWSLFFAFRIGATWNVHCGRICSINETYLTNIYLFN